MVFLSLPVPLSPVSLHFVARMPAQSGLWTTGIATTTFFIQTTIGK
jgi:hypothetical protein